MTAVTVHVPMLVVVNRPPVTLQSLALPFETPQVIEPLVVPPEVVRVSAVP